MTDQPGAVPSGAGSPPMSERMQALLSRAMEDQASEQRQIQSLLAELRTLLGHLPTEVSAAVAEHGTDQELRARVDELAAHLGQLGQHIAGLARAVEARSAYDRATDETASLAVVNAVQTATDNVLARIEPLTQRVAELASRAPAASAPSEDTTARLTAMEGRLDELARGFADTHRRVVGLDNALGPVPEEVRALSERMDSRVAARLDRLDDIATAIVELRGLQGGDASVVSELSTIRAGVDALASRPTLAEDREGVVLAIRQLLGETVQAALQDAMAQSEQRLREHVGQIVRSGSAEGEQRIVGQVGQAFRSATSETERAMRQNLEQSLQASLDASEKRILGHVETAVVALAEALLRKKPQRKPPSPAEASKPAGPPAPAAPAPPPTGPPAGAPAGSAAGSSGGPPTGVAADELHELAAPTPQVRAAAPHPALEEIRDPDVTVEDPPVGPPRQAGGGDESSDHGGGDEGRRKRGWFRSND